VEVAALEILRQRKPERSLQTNVEFHTALLLEALGFDPDAFTCVLAVDRPRHHAPIATVDMAVVACVMQCGLADLRRLNDWV